MERTVRLKRTAGALLLAVVGTTALVGCSGAGATTCAEYGAQSSSEQTNTMFSLLNDHDLEPYASGNLMGLTSALTTFCGLTFGGGATQNLYQPIEAGVDWESETW